MLNSFRSLSKGFTAKLLLALLVLSFAFWGIEDMLRHPMSGRTVATVGSETITTDEYVRAMQRDRAMLKAQLGDNITPQMLKALHMPEHSLQQLINNKLIRQETEALGLVPSDADIARNIRANNAFHDSKGEFDNTLFQVMLKNNNISEKTYVARMRQEMASGLLLETLLTVSPASDTAVRTLYAAQEEQRALTLYGINDSLVKDVPQPTDAQLKEYYDAHAADFTAPEYRTLSYIVFTGADVPDGGKVSEEDLLAAYKSRIDEFKRPERRTVEQLLFNSEDKAKVAHQQLLAGKDLKEVAKSSDILNKDNVSMGKVERKALFDAAADPVFALKAGESTTPIQSPFGWHVFHVVSIEQPVTEPFEAVRATLEQDMKQRGADDALNRFANKLEDTIAGGGTLQEAVKGTRIQVQSVGPVNHKSQSPEGGDVALPDLDKFLDIAFKLEEGRESSVTTSKGGKYYLVRVDKLAPGRLRSLDEVRGAVSAGWQKQERAKFLGELAKVIGDKFSDAASRGTVTAKYSLSSMGSATVRRSSRTANGIMIPAGLISEAFSLKLQQGTHAYVMPNGNYVIAVLDRIIPADAPDKDARLKNVMKEINTNMKNSVQNEILEQYAAYLAEKYKVSVNDTAAKAAADSFTDQER